MSPAARGSRTSRTGAAAGQGRLKGRHWIVFWLGLFLATALAIVARQSAAIATVRTLRDLERERGALEVQKAMLDGSVHRQRSRGVIVPLAERRLGLRLPQDSEITIVQEPRPR